MFTDDLAEKMKERAGEKYRPANGAEGMIFMDNFCLQCSKDNYNGDVPDTGCPIIADTLTFSVDDENYPQEWQYGEDGQPKCTAFDPKPVSE